MNVPGGYCIPTIPKSNKNNSSRLPIRGSPSKPRSNGFRVSKHRKRTEPRPPPELSAVLGLVQHKPIQSTSNEHVGAPQENTLRDLLKRTKVPLENDQLPDEATDSKPPNDITWSPQSIEEDDRVHAIEKIEQSDGDQQKDLSCKSNKTEFS